MGMFDKDKEIGIVLQTWIEDGVPFIVWDARIIRDDFPTNLGPAVQAGLTVSRVETPGERYDVTTLASAIAAKVREAEVDDFPAVVQTMHVASRYGQDAYVLSFLKPYGRQEQDPRTRWHSTTPPPPPIGSLATDYDYGRLPDPDDPGPTQPEF